MDHSQDEIANCSACKCPMDVSMLAPFTNVKCPDCGEHNRVKTDVGSYVLMKRQGVGGMSLVFGAIDKTLGREVAIKILNEDYSMDEKRIEQFEQEARITAAMSHPHIVKVFTVGQAFSRFFIAMELVSGDSLEQKMSDHGALSESEVLHWSQQIADGLNAANESGLIHRDIKPGNILFDKDGHVKIVDFGLALVTQGGKAQADEIWATPYYVPPEALDVAEEDFRSDIYALGASLFHALSGNPPFNTETRSTTELKAIKQKLPSLKEAAPWLSDQTCNVIDKAMAFDMNDRFSSYQELIEALHYAESVVNSDGDDFPIDSAVNNAQRLQSPTKSSWLMPSLVGLSILFIGGVLFSIFKEKDKPKNSDPPVVRVNGVSSGEVVGAMSKRVGAEITIARGSLRNQNYSEAAKRYARIANDSSIPVDTVYWASLQVATINWLDGKPGVSRKVINNLFKLYSEQKSNGSAIGKRITQSTGELGNFDKVEAKQFPEIQTDVDATIGFASALKNWSNGYIKEAVQMFELVEKYKPEELSDELVVYRSRITDYQGDAVLLGSLRKNFYPKTMEELKQRVSKLNDIKSNLKTKGRAHFDIAEWITQCELHEKRLQREAKEATIAANQAKILAKNRLAGIDPSSPPESWKELLDSISKDVRDCNFEKIERLLDQINLPEEKDNLRKEQLKYICRNAEGFKVSLKQNITNREVNATLELKNGTELTSIHNVTTEGVEILEETNKRLIKWGAVEPSSLVDLHKFNVSSSLNLSNFEKNIRLEQAICFAWITGETLKSQIGAKRLEEVNPLFESRWTHCMNLLEGKQ